MHARSSHIDHACDYKQATTVLSRILPMSTHPRPSTNQLLEPAEREYCTTPLVDKYGLGSKAIMPPYYLNVQFPMGPIYTQFDVLSTLSSHQARSPNRQVNPQCVSVLVCLSTMCRVKFPNHDHFAHVNKPTGSQRQCLKTMSMVN